jgi:hypothetical protein
MSTWTLTAVLQGGSVVSIPGFTSKAAAISAGDSMVSGGAAIIYDVTEVKSGTGNKKVN